MCRADEAERVEELSRGRRRARAAHVCSECRREIAPGEMYAFTVYLWEGKFEQEKGCSHCCVLREWLGENCGGWVYGELIEEIQEHAEEYRRFDLYRMVLLAGHGWRRKGALVPVPAMPKSLAETLGVAA